MKTKASILTAMLGLAFAMFMNDTASAQGRYANVYSRAEVGAFISQLERSSNRFRRDFDRAMDRSNINGTSQEDEFNGNIRSYTTSLTNLRRQFNRSNNWWSIRNAAQDMISAAQPVNSMMVDLPFGRNLETQWRDKRRDINKVADVWDLPGLEGGGWMGGGNNNGGNNGGNNNGGGWNWGGTGNMSSPPNWARGSFNGTGGSEGRQIIIDRNGRVTVFALGLESYGTYNNNIVYVNGESLQIRRINGGIQLYNPNGGGTSEWVR